MNDDLLIHRYLDGTIKHEDMTALNQRLREDAKLRERLRDIAAQATAFGDMARTRVPPADVRPSHGSPESTARKRERFGITWLALAATVAILATNAWLFVVSKPRAVLTLVESTGSVSWSHGTEIEPGQTLPAGTLETIGESTSALFRFDDGSLITLQGEAELSFSEDPQKVLTLARGTLSAEVRPQPAGRPMLIRTPSAVAEVVGTAFDLSARADDTLLKVNTGLVKLKRLADGGEIEVAANRSALASLRTDSKLNVCSTPDPLTSWSFDFTQQTPPRDWRGFAKDGCMNAMPYIAKKSAAGGVTTHYGISIRTAMLEAPIRLVATERSVIRYRLRQGRSGALHLMLLTNKPDGGFGGNFEVQLEQEELKPGADGWCEVEVPFTRFSAISARHTDLAGNILTSVLLFSANTTAKPAVARFGLITP